MPFQQQSKRNSRKSRKIVNIHQNSFEKGYISTFDDSRRPIESLSDMTNMELVQDHVSRPRPPLVAYGTQPTFPAIGRGKFYQSRERYNLWMMDTGANGVLYKQKDGGGYTVLGGSNTYDDEAWASGVQNKNKVYIYNGVDNLSYVDLATDAVVKYTALTTPSISSVVYSGTAGGSTHYYRVTASNSVGESIASTVSSDNAAKDRNSWVNLTDFCTISWGAVSGAVTYTIYYGNTADTQLELYSVGSDQTSFIDYGTLATNPFKIAPEGNSTEGAVFTHMHVDKKNGTVYGVTADNLLYYSSPGSISSTADFSPYNGGGYVPIDENGDTQLNYVTSFRNGKGDPVITVSARGAAGRGNLFHVTFETLTVGDQAIVYPNVYEANGQSGTYAPRATILNGDAIDYPTGLDFKSTGTSQNIVNILTTQSIAQAIEPDVAKINLEALSGAVGVELRQRNYYALPVGSSSNNEIWVHDKSRKGNPWILRWPVAAKDMWLYEDNAGDTHFCVLVGNRILEFTRAGSRSHQDDNVAWRSRLAFSALVWDEDGLNLAKIRRQYFKLLQPRGSITVNATGLTRNGTSSAAGSDTFVTTTTATGIGQWQYGGAFLAKDAAYKYGDDPGSIDSYGKSVAVLQIKPKGLLAELSWEIIGNTSGTDYIHSATNTKGQSLEDLVLKA